LADQVHWGLQEVGLGNGKDGHVNLRNFRIVGGGWVTAS